MRVRKLIYSIFLLCLAGIAVPALQAQGTIPCSDATLNGKYILNGHGTNVEFDLLGLIQAQQHVEDIGYLVLDGNGNVSNGSLDETVDNTSTTSTPSGTYSLLASCSGTLTLNVNGTTRHYQLSSSIPFAGASGISSDLYLFDSDGTTDISLRGARTFDPTGGCTTNILSGEVAIGDGHGGFANENVSTTAQITFNADGTFNLTESGSTNGTITSSIQRSGTYAIQGDCSVKLFADSASGGFQIGMVFLEIPQPAVTNASVRSNAASIPQDNCPGCQGGFAITWDSTSSTDWQPLVLDSGNVSGKFEFSPQPPQS